MPNKDEKDCGCTGSIDLEKTTKNINLNISKQTRKHNHDHIKEENNKKYKNESDCKSAAKKRYNIEYDCKTFCRLESKRLYKKKMNCYDLINRNNEEYDKRIKAIEDNKNCREDAKKLFGNNTKVQNCGELEDECKIQSKKKFGRKMNCSIYKREKQCREDAIKEFKKAYSCDELDRQKDCTNNAKGIFGRDTNIKGCTQLENKIKIQKQLGRNIERARFLHMTKVITGTRTENDGTEVEVQNQNGVQLKLKGGDIFIQTYDMGENILVAKHNIWTLEKDGKINKYLSKNLNMPDYPTYKEFIGDYFTNEVFRHQDYKEYNSRSNLIEILDMRGSFKDKERMDFDLGGEYFKERVNLRRVTISNANGIRGEQEQEWAEIADFDFKTIPADLSDPVKTRGPKDARFLTTPYTKDFTSSEIYRFKDYNTSPRVNAIQEKAGSYIGLTPYKQKWKTSEDETENQENRRIEEPKDWIPSLNKLFKIHNKKITSDIWVFNKRTDWSKSENDTVLNYMSPLRPKNEMKHDGTYKVRSTFPATKHGDRLGNGLARFYEDLHPINSTYFKEIGYAQCFSRNRWTRGTTPDWAWGVREGGKMDNVFYPRLLWGPGYETFWNVGELIAQNAGMIYNSNYRKNETSFKSPEHYFYSILYNKHYVWAKNINNFGGPDENKSDGDPKYRTFDMPISANLVDFLDIEVMHDKPVYCCKRNADTLWDHHTPYKWEMERRGATSKRDQVDGGINEKITGWNTDRAWSRNKTNYKDAYSKGSAIETNFDEIMKFLKNEYNTVKGNEADDSITPYEFRRYWSSKLNFRNEPFVLGTRPFKGCINLEEVILELKQIKTGTQIVNGKTVNYGTFNQYFMGLENLRKVHLPDSIKATGTQTFSGCERLNELAMPGVTRISDRTFEKCESLTQFTINDGMNYIHPTAFIGCTRLKKLIIKNKNPQVFNLEVFVGNKFFNLIQPKIDIIELDSIAFESSGENNKLINKNFSKNFNHSLKRIIYPVKNKQDKNLFFETSINFKYFNVNKTYVYNGKRYTYYKDLSQLPNYLLKDLSNEKLDGVKTVGLKFNPDKLPDGYISLKTRKNKYNIFGPDVDIKGASLNLINYDLTNVELPENLFDLYTFKSVGLVFKPKSLPPGYFILKTIKNKYDLFGPNLDIKVDLKDYNLTNVELTKNFLDSLKSKFKSVGLEFKPKKLPDGYFSLKTRNNKYNLFGPKFDTSDASFNLRDYDLTNVDLSGNLIKLIISTNFNTYDIIYDQPPKLPENYVIKVNRLNKKMIIGPGVNLTNADLTDVNLNGTDITNINFKNATFNNVIATNVKTNVKINTKATNIGQNIGHKVFRKNNQKFLLGPGLYFDKFNFSSMNFQELKLSNCVFRNCNFTSTDFRKADLTNCSFINCNLTDAQINNKTTLKGLKSNALTYKNVKIINFHFLIRYKIYGKNGNGILIGPWVDLSNQNLSDLDLSRANMYEVTIHKTIINDNTKLPSNIDRSKFIVVKSKK